LSTDKPPTDESGRSSDGRSPVRRPGPNIWLLVLMILALAIVLAVFQGTRRSTIRYDFFVAQIKDKNVLYVELGDAEATGTFKIAPNAPKVFNDGQFVDAKEEKLLKNFRVSLPRTDQARSELIAMLDANGAKFDNSTSANNLMMTVWLFAIFLPLGLLLFFWISYRRSRDQIMGGGFLSGFSKSPAKRYEPSDQTITFQDVAGLKGVKEDLQEIIDFLKSPEKFQKLGGRVPKGVLLNGAPGTGKTLLARAVAGEAGVPFYSLSASEFIQMFVGVGASRVRDLFKNAKDNSPAIIFIDEIDAVGRQRGAGLGGGHDEREQTLNQILSEMDGFSQTDAVIVLAATNRPDVLDPALLRPGRFDRHVTVNRPTHKGRVEIFKVHVRDVPLAEDVDLTRLASSTVGLTGADIRNIVNEAALWAARGDKKSVDMEDFGYARDKVLMGAKREEVLQDDEKQKTAYHEAGHTIVAWLRPGADPVHKVTIIPRGRSLGATHMMPAEDRLSVSESLLHDNLVVLLGGRAAELIVYDETTVGAENDLERATGLARRMVTHWGMSQRLGPVSYKLSDDDPFLGREIHQQRQFSEHTMEIIDEEVAKILHASADEAVEMLKEHRDKLERLAAALLEEEELDDKEIADLIGPSANGNGVKDSAGDGE